MNRDIDYAAVAVRAAIVAKFGRANELADLKATVRDKSIVLQHGARQTEGTRDQLLALLRAADSYDKLWETSQTSARS